MQNFYYWQVYEGAAEDSGRSENVWLINPDNGKIGLFKFKKDVSTTDHISECIAYKLAITLGIPCAVFELGMYHNREGSMSYNIVTTGDQILIEEINYINTFYPGYDAETFVDTNTGDLYSVEMVQRVTQGVFDFADFLHMLIFDFLIGNSDRHQSNWAVLYDNKKSSFAPLYDNGSSLCAFISDEQVSSYLGKDMVRWHSLVNTKSKSLIRRTVSDTKRPTHLEMIHYLHDNYFEQTSTFSNKIVQNLSDKKIYEIIDDASEGLLSNCKRELIFRFIREKVSMLKMIYGEKE